MREFSGVSEEREAENAMLPSQGTMGAFGSDSWGNTTVATSTEGLTNKAPGGMGIRRLWVRALGLRAGTKIGIVTRFGGLAQASLAVYGKR